MDATNTGEVEEDQESHSGVLRVEGRLAWDDRKVKIGRAENMEHMSFTAIVEQLTEEDQQRTNVNTRPREAKKTLCLGPCIFVAATPAWVLKRLLFSSAASRGARAGRKGICNF